MDIRFLQNIWNFSNSIDYLDQQKDHGFISTTIIKTRLMFNRYYLSASHDGMLSYIAQLVQNLKAQSTNGSSETIFQTSGTILCA